MRLVIAEKDKEKLESKLSASSEALESLNEQMNGLSLKLDSTEETIKARMFFLLILNLVKKLIWKVDWFEIWNSNEIYCYPYRR